jgi:predicted nucleic-acid-binding Zn-ribbon protein
MALTRAQRRTVEDWLADQITPRSPGAQFAGFNGTSYTTARKNAWWTVGNDLYGMAALAPGTSHAILNLQHGQAFASVCCNKCGYVMLFHERTNNKPVR